MSKLNRHEGDEVTMMRRVCALLCLLLMLFSLGHAAVGHASAFDAPSLHGSSSVLSQATAPGTGDTADACALCVALSTAVVLAIFAFGLQRQVRPRFFTRVAVILPLTGWHASLSCRPPPAL